MTNSNGLASSAHELSDEIKKLHADFVAEIHKREVSSSENFDKSVLAFSSAGLGFSIGFLKDFLPIELARAPWTLYLSWILFTLATCATMASFLVSSRALADQKTLAFAYYIERDETAFNRSNRWNQRTMILNYTSGTSFLLAMVLSVVFVSINLAKGSAMKHTTSKPTQELVKRGLPVPTLQQVPRPAPSQTEGAVQPAPPQHSPKPSEKK